MEMISIDSLVDKRDITPKFIKIDVEGFELEALFGALETIRKFRPVIAFEFNVLGSHNNSYFIYKLFKYNNYKIFDCFGNKINSTTWRTPKIAPIDRIAIPSELEDDIMVDSRKELDLYWEKYALKKN